jgi:MFS family permease
MGKTINSGLCIWGVGSLFYLYEMILRIATGVMADDLRTDFGLMGTQLGFLASAYYYAYTPLQIPSGLLLDHLGVRRIITVSSALCAFSAFLFAHSYSFAMAIFARFLLGAGSACAFIGCLKLASKWFDISCFPLMVGLTNMMGCLGGMFSGELIAQRMNAVGWRQTLIEFSWIGLGVTVLCWFFIKDGPAIQPLKETVASPKMSLKELKKSLATIAYKPQIWLSGLIGGLMYVPVTGFAELWAIPFLVKTYGITKEKASLVNVCFFLGMALGSPLMARVFHYVKSYRLVIATSSAILAFLFLPIALCRFIPFWATFGITGLAGMIMGSQVLTFSLSQNHVSQEQSGTAAAFTNCIIMLSGIIFQPLLGGVLDFFWTGQTNESGIRIYDDITYSYGILILPLCFVFSLALSFFISAPPKSQEK